MNGSSVAAQFELTYRVIGVNLDGVTHEESVLHPQGGGSSINWILGHLVVSRNSILKLLGEGPVWTDDQCETYARGADLPVDAGSYLPFDEIRAALRESQERLFPKMSALPDEAGVIPSFEGSILSKLLFLQFHEAYHVGQLGAVRRWVGKEGAIK